MKTSKNIALSILLSLALIAAPSTLAQPSPQTFDGFSVVELVKNVIDSLVSIFDSVTGGVDPTGLQNEADQDPAPSYKPEQPKPTEGSVTGAADPAG